MRGKEDARCVRPSRHAGASVFNRTVKRHILWTLALAALVSGCANVDSGRRAASLPDSVKTVESSVARQGYFYVGGRYVGEPGAR